MMSSDVTRYGVVGLGRAGWNIHVAGLRPREDAKIVAVVDPVEERRAEAASEFGCQTHENIADLIAQDDVDVVVVATPSAMHAPDTIAALQGGKHVAVEKPMSMDVAEADAMIAAAEKADRKLFVHQNYRFKPEFQHLLEIRDSGIIGKVYHLRNYTTGFARRNDWQTLKKNGGGVLNNTCPHFLDMLMQLAGAPIVDVMGDLQQIASAGDVEDHVKAFLRADNGVTIDMEITSAQNLGDQKLPKWIMCGSTGTLVSDGATSTIRYFDPKEAGPIEVVEGAVAGRKYGNDDQLPWQEKTVEATGPDIGDFYDNVTAVLQRGEAMYITPQSVREVIRVIAEIRKSAGQ